MGRLLLKAASAEVLNRAWKRLRNNMAPWQPGVSRREMESDFAYHLLNLADELGNGCYKPDAARFFPANKGDGKQRIISALTLRDKLAQRAVLTVLEPIGEKIFHYNSFGYRQGRTIDMVLSRIREYMLCGLTWIVDADIQNFFDNIPHKPLIKMVKSLISDREMAALIYRWLDSGTARKGFISTPKGIPQGAVLSPFLCNLYLTQWDNEMAAKNFPFVRFADDFLVFAESREQAQKAHTYVAKSLRKLHLTLNPQKTQITKCGPGVRFLGKKLPNLKSQGGAKPRGRRHG